MRSHHLKLQLISYPPDPIILVIIYSQNDHLKICAPIYHLFIDRARLTRATKKIRKASSMVILKKVSSKTATKNSSKKATNNSSKKATYVRVKSRPLAVSCGCAMCDLCVQALGQS